MKTSAVIPAVGISTRMLEMKPLLCFENSTIIRHSIRSLKSVGIQDIIVVTGYQSAVLERHLKSEGVMFIKNERYAVTDMLSSVNLGRRALPDQKKTGFCDAGRYATGFNRGPPTYYGPRERDRVS